MNYQEFLDSKLNVLQGSGLIVDQSQINARLFPFQRQLVQWALKKGRSALFADTGLGKTWLQLEWARLLDVKTLIVAPLAVANQTVKEAETLGIDVTYVRSPLHLTDGINITNYEMIDHFDPSVFEAVVLDESSILKSVDGKTRTKLIDMFRNVPYRLACTATPAPNDIAEFANHAAFLGICTREEMLSMFFVHDDDGWRLKGHAKQAFYQWMASWAMMLKRPSDIGFDDDGYILPDLNIDPIWIEGDAQKAAHDAGQLFVLGLQGIQGRSSVRKATIDTKIEKAIPLLNDGQQWVVWTILNEEGRQLVKHIDGAVLVEGQDSIDHKIDALRGFVEGKYRVLISKTKIAGFGLNMQHCHKMMFLGLTDSYESYYQAIRRCWRFGQQHPVNVKIILSDLEAPILDNVQRKEAQAEEVQKAMVSHVAEFQKAELGLTTYSKNGYHTDDKHGDGWELKLGDCVERIKEVDDNSVDFSIFSPPFMSLYVYSDSERDMGNSRTEAQFMGHFRFLITELLRVVKPGRNVAVHVAQVPAKKVVDGFIGLKDFRGKVIEQFIQQGFIYHGEVVVDKDPQAQAIRTKSKSLMFVQLKKDASWLRPGLADYILIFRKPGENQVPIHPDIDNEAWIEWARPVWYNIRESDTLNVVEGRANEDERHIAPLQLGTIERCIRLWSNPGELVLSPFAGIGSEGYEAIRLERRFIGIELKGSYFEAACTNLQKAVMNRTQIAMPI